MDGESSDNNAIAPLKHTLKKTYEIENKPERAIMVAVHNYTMQEIQQFYQSKLYVKTERLQAPFSAPVETQIVNGTKMAKSLQAWSENGEK